MMTQRRFKWLMNEWLRLVMSGGPWIGVSRSFRLMHSGPSKHFGHSCVSTCFLVALARSSVIGCINCKHCRCTTLCTILLRNERLLEMRQAARGHNSTDDIKWWWQRRRNDDNNQMDSLQTKTSASVYYWLTNLIHLYAQYLGWAALCWPTLPLTRVAARGIRTWERSNFKAQMQLEWTTNRE